MKDSAKFTPDFAVQWCDSSQAFESQIFLEDPALTNDALLQEKMRAPLILLESATTCVAVSDLCWNEPTSVSLVPDRPAFCMSVSTTPQMAIQYGYDDEVNIPASTGNTLFLVPGRKITGRGGVGSLRSVMVSVETGYAERFLGNLEALTEAQLIRGLNIQNALITSLLFRLLKEAMHPGSMSDAVVETCTNSLLVECAHWLNEDQSVEETRGRLTPRHLTIIEEYLNAVQGRLPSVAELAKACGFSERHFLNLFREEKKCTVAQYIKSFQVSRAKTYLLETDLPLKEIAYRLGFSSPANFSSAFRAATGKTPGQLRKGE